MSPADASSRSNKIVDFTGLEWAWPVDGGVLSFLRVFVNAKTFGQWVSMKGFDECR